MAKIKMLFLNKSICSQRSRDFFSIGLLLMMTEGLTMLLFLSASAAMRINSENQRFHQACAYK
ncbi:hypothetical protein [Methylobacter sp. YRD-M1]|uniref:hypothetical protein n=1 Tax=Methylobacter sp. YRD-M1 TaxID=2911520 RepID=UPI00227AF381|nr:hypothetical protein [Methylobacter sp. YRD-M1]WAK02043.1 hypothetical protein LZ558_19875 [Methylobacter sp. YRD-M1]